MERRGKGGKWGNSRDPATGIIGGIPRLYAPPILVIKSNVAAGAHLYKFSLNGGKGLGSIKGKSSKYAVCVYLELIGGLVGILYISKVPGEVFIGCALGAGCNDLSYREDRDRGGIIEDFYGEAVFGGFGRAALDNDLCPVGAEREVIGRGYESRTK